MKQSMSIWSRNCDIDPSFTKPIAGRDYRGTSPDPHKIIEMLTSEFGPIGKGFGWHVLQEDFQPLGEGVLLHWCRIKFWWKDQGETHSYESYGQTKAAYIAGKGENQYLRTDEDAPKKSLTDAVTKAASQLGFAASIYLGLYDDNKYVEGLDAKFRWREEHERDSRFWDAVYDSLPPDPSADAVSERASEYILQKVLEYKKAESVNKYLRIHSERFRFVEVHAPEVFEDLKEKIVEHRESLEEAA